MNTTNGLIGQWSQWMLHAGWQAAVVAIAVMILLLFMRRRISSQLRYAVLCVALLKFAAPPFLIGAGAWFEAGVFSSDDWISVPQFYIDSSISESVEADSTGAPQNGQLTESDAEEKSAVITASANNQAASISRRQATSVSAVAASESIPRWLLLLAIVYLCGVIASVIAIARQLTRVRQFVRRACSDPDTLDRSTALCKHLKMKRPRILVSDEVDSPFATGVLRPAIVLPRTMIHDLAADQLDIVLAHELVHIRRRDLLTGWLEVMLTVVWWFHPVIWWLRSSLRRTREECCDDALVACQLAQRVRYCETLIQVARCQAFSFSEPIVLGFSTGEHPAANRIRRLMDSKLLRRNRLLIPAIALTLLLALLLLPGMKPEESPVIKTNLEGWFGWKNLKFQISEEEESRVKELRTIAQAFFHTRNDVRQFDEPGTRERLEIILKEQPEFFVR